MEPTLAEGDHILVAHLQSHQRPLHVGDLVVSRHPFQDRIIVKRIRTILDGRVELMGDNPTTAMIAVASAPCQSIVSSDG